MFNIFKRQFRIKAVTRQNQETAFYPQERFLGIWSYLTGHGLKSEEYAKQVIQSAMTPEIKDRVEYIPYQ